MKISYTFIFFTLLLLFSNAILSQSNKQHQQKHPRLQMMTKPKSSLSIKNNRIWQEMFLAMYGKLSI